MCGISGVPACWIPTTTTRRSGRGQGSRDLASYGRLKDYFSGQRFVDFGEPAVGHASAARLYLDCRRRGVTVRSSQDCLIAQCAIESGLTLFHNDGDFRNIGSVAPALKETSFLRPD